LQLSDIPRAKSAKGIEFRKLFLLFFVFSFENVGKGVSLTLKQPPSIPSFQHGGLESRSTWMSPEASLRTWMPAIHAGMTSVGFSSSVDERKLMNHFVVKNFLRALRGELFLTT
jgi:hypothetical protein